jgi:hypothetical protein
MSEFTKIAAILFKNLSDALISQSSYQFLICTDINVNKS